MSVSSRFAILIAGIVAGFGCASTDTAEEVKEAPRIPYRIAIAPFEATPGQTADWTAHDLQLRLVDRLRELDCASEVYPLKAGEDVDADLLVKPRLTEAFQYQYSEATGGAVASSLLWLGTWVGGLFVDDSSYESRLAVDFDIEMVRDNSRLQSVQIQQMDPVDVDFLERNDFLSWPMVQSWIIPPFLTSDDPRVLGNSLLGHKLDQVGADLARDLKFDFEKRELERCATIRFDSPASGEVAGDVELDFTVRSGSSIDAIEIQRDQQPTIRVYPRVTPNEGEVEELDGARAVRVRFTLQDVGGGLGTVIRVLAKSESKITTRSLVLGRAR